MCVQNTHCTFDVHDNKYMSSLPVSIYTNISNINSTMNEVKGLSNIVHYNMKGNSVPFSRSVCHIPNSYKFQSTIDKFMGFV